MDQDSIFTRALRSAVESRELAPIIRLLADGYCPTPEQWQTLATLRLAKPANPKTQAEIERRKNAWRHYRTLRNRGFNRDASLRIAANAARLPNKTLQYIVRGKDKRVAEPK